MLCNRGYDKLVRPDSAQSKFPLEISLRGDCLLCDEDPRPPIAAHPQGFLQSKNALRRTSTSKFAARQHNHQLSCKPVSACKPERECYQKPQKIAPLKGSSNLEPPGFQKGRGPFVSEGVQSKPFQGFPLGNFFAAARHRASLRS